MPRPTHPYVTTWAGFLYVAVVIDAFSRRVIGWAMETHLRTELVLAALEMAYTQRAPCQNVGSQNLWTPAGLRFSKASPPFG